MNTQNVVPIIKLGTQGPTFNIVSRNRAQGANDHGGLGLDVDPTTDRMASSLDVATVAL